MRIEFPTAAKSSTPPDIEPIALGQNGVTFMRATLDKNGPLPSAVAQLFEKADTVFALLPAGTSPERATQYGAGGFMKMGAAHKWLADSITSSCGPAGCQLIFVDAWTFPADLKSNVPQQPYFTADSSIMYAPDSRNVLNALNAGMREVGSFLLLGFVISPQVPLSATGENASRATIDLLAQNTQIAFASAYDQESYVVWQKQPRNF